MKDLKILIIVYLIVCTKTLSHAQVSRLGIGIEVGPGLIDVRSNPMNQQDKNIPNSNLSFNSTIGFTVGTSIHYNLNKTFCLVSGVYFDRKGSFLRSQSSNASGNANSSPTINKNLDYLTIPMLLRASFGNKAKFYINAGPYAGFLLSYTIVFRDGNKPSKSSNNLSLMNRFDTGLTSGIGVMIPIKTKISFSAEIRNNLGLFNIAGTPTLYFPDGVAKTISTNLIISAVYKLGE